MARVALVTALAGLLFALVGCGEKESAGDPIEQSDPPEWSYSGSTGPENWGSLSSEYAACSEGTEQSPIDLAGGSGDPPALEVEYGSSPLALVNNGHSVEAEIEGEHAITLDGTRYTLAQFHFHAPSEHTLEGEALALELHFVNAAEDGSLAVLGVMVREGGENPAWSGVTDALANTVEEGDGADVGQTDLAALLPADPASARRWSYPGSLTTPPCSEGVAWTVFADPIEMSAAQIASFTSAYDGNARPVQPLGDRELLRGS
jgi:carbonic anhydrase